MIRRVALCLTALLILFVPSVRAVQADAASHKKIDYMPTRLQVLKQRAAKQASKPSDGGKVAYVGGKIEVTPKAYLVVYGSQWKNGDPDQELVTLGHFLQGLEGPQDTWSTLLTQYCQGAPMRATTCGPDSTKAVHPDSAVLTHVFFDVTAPAPQIPDDPQFEAEARKAAKHFGNTTPASNVNAQYIIATPKGFNADGAGVDFCAWHSFATSIYGNLAYVNLPYIPQLKYNCGAGMVNTPGPNDGVSIVAGHEYVESVEDPFPSLGWVDGNSDEIADKCAWINPGLPGGAINISLSTGTFPVQSLWSNNFGTKGGCASSYISAAKQRG